MANYFLTETAQFKPFSYQEMLAPIQAYKEGKEKAETELETLEDAAAAQAFTFQGSNYESEYNNYITGLNKVSEDLSSGNYNPTDTKKAIKDLRKQFLNTLAPAAQRITKLNALRTEQDTKQANNPFIKFSVDYRDKSEKDITANSTYSTYDLSKVYKQIAEDTLSRISQDYHPQVGDPIKIEGTNSYIIKHGYGLTPEQYNEQRSNQDSDLSKFVNREIQKATQGIKEDSIKKEVEAEVENIIKSNIGKFEPTTIKSSNNNESNANFFRAAEAAYRYKWGIDSKGNPIILGESDQYKLDHGWTKNADGTWTPPRNSGQGAVYQSAPQNPIILSADELTAMLGVQNFWKSRSTEVYNSKEFNLFKDKPMITEVRSGKEYTGIKFNPNTELVEGSTTQNWIKDTVGEDNIDNYMYLYNKDAGELYILPQKQYKINSPTSTTTDGGDDDPSSDGSKNTLP